MAVTHKGTYAIAHGYVLREFLLSMTVSFTFFFFIFFVNQILLLAQKILLKNVGLPAMLALVGLAVPQILLYTLPFSTMTASSMTIGELSSRNEILAMRSCGIPMRQLYVPIIACAVLLSCTTYAVADVLLPYSSQRYKQMYAELLQELPTLELDSFSVNRVGDKILVTGEVQGQTINDLVMFDVPGQGGGTVISAKQAHVFLVDVRNLLYRLELENPVLLETDGKSTERFSFSDARSMVYYLDFSTQVQRLTDATPSQLSSRDLRAAIASRKLERDERQRSDQHRVLALHTRLAETAAAFITAGGGDQLLAEMDRLTTEIESLQSQRAVNFYLQYYRAELHKKMALSAACLFLVFITFPLSFVRIKHGRLFGFGLSLLMACAYWFMLFFAQTKILDFTINPGFLIWAPDMVIVALAAVLLAAMRRA
jgi:lipopolysaccharide export system permease protein